MKLIPAFIAASADFTQRLTLGGVNVTLRTKWNSRAESWWIHLSTDTGPLGDIALVPQWPILRQFKAYQPGLAGELLVLPLSKDPGPLMYENLGVTWGLFYLSDAEFEEWEARRG